MKPKLLYSVLTTISITALVSSSFLVAESKELKKEDIKQLREKKAAISNQILKKNDIIGNYLKQVELAQKKIEAIQKDVEPLQNAYNQAEKEKEKFLDQMKRKIRISYQKGEYNFLASLFSAGSLSELLVRYEMLRILVKEDYHFVQEGKKKVALAAQRKKAYDQKIAEQQKIIDAGKKAYLAIQKELDKDKSNLKYVQKIEELHQDEVIQINLEEWNNGTLRFPFLGKMILPVNGRQSSGWGYRHDPFHGCGRMHHGQDWAAPEGTPVYAAADGVVVSSEASGGYGWLITVYHGEKNGQSIFTRYAHSYPRQVAVRVGQQVTAGQKITEVGSNGRSTGNHLHFEVRVSKERDPNGPDVDPMDWIK